MLDMCKQDVGCSLICFEWSVLVLLFFFFKQKTAYEILIGLVGSEMCIRDRTTRVSPENGTG